MDVLQMDGMYNISLMGGQARAILIEGTQMVERARQIHGLSRTATAALGRTLMATSMMGSMLKGENESLTVTIKGGGPIGTIMAVGKADASVKGYVAFRMWNCRAPPMANCPWARPWARMAASPWSRISACASRMWAWSTSSPARSPRTSPCISLPRSRCPRWCRWACWWASAWRPRAG